ncbi:dUTPase [Betaentomopoxvirus amoorei]|uniref:Deoxyuridine 5'-triphosphate nucleotidohydrolase n=1 Tax=Amsacta moorei entomopoxvirus TaxID=28321 RepID=Q9EN44_AMEPV|nr:dUTPase [Amsacta moorei entomopoxvirus]AAG02708.1 AMV002 [Amsacta moorei entomopoxvirus]
MEPIFKYMFVTENAFEPIRQTSKSAGMDLKSAYDYIVSAHDKKLIKTDLIIEIPKGCYARLAPRSDLALNKFIDIGAGVIDEDYRGNVGVILFNHSNEDFIINRGDRISQLICEKILYPKMLKVDSLSETKRSDFGFGSTGYN